VDRHHPDPLQPDLTSRLGATVASVTEGDETMTAPPHDNSLGRVLALSDGVFAIALTLLALNLHVPDVGRHPSNAALQHALAQHVSSYLTFFLSFYVVASYWRRHRRLMRSVQTIDQSLVSYTLFLLMCVAALPFPAALLGQYGSRAISLVTYGGLNAVAVITMLRLHHVVRAHGLRGPSDPDREADRKDVYELVGMLIVFLLCIPAGYVFPGNGAWVLLLFVVVQRWQPVWRFYGTRRDRRSRGSRY
jgi:uncharacterized membrane protein